MKRHREVVHAQTCFLEERREVPNHRLSWDHPRRSFAKKAYVNKDIFSAPHFRLVTLFTLQPKLTMSKEKHVVCFP